MKIAFKKNNGYTALDLSVSIIVILISVSIIAAILYNLYLSGTGMKRNVIATDYAINVLEIIQATEYSLVTFNQEDDETMQLKSVLDTLLNSTDSQIIDEQYVSNINNYTIIVNIEKYSDRFDTENSKEDYIKIITVTVKYNLGKNNDNTINTEQLQISTLKTIK